MSRSSQNFSRLTVVVGGYVVEQCSDGTSNLPYSEGRESDLDFSAILKALRAVFCLHGGATRSAARAV
jgi:hypothetical protein